VVKMLIKYDVDIIKKDRRQKTLYLAAMEGHELTAQTLLDSGANVNA
jgi:hypothetical protein